MPYGLLDYPGDAGSELELHVEDFVVGGLPAHAAAVGYLLHLQPPGMLVEEVFDVEKPRSPVCIAHMYAFEGKSAAG